MLDAPDFERFARVLEQLEKVDISNSMKKDIRIIIDHAKRADRNAIDDELLRFKMADNVATMVDTGDLRGRINAVCRTLEELERSLADIYDSAGRQIPSDSVVATPVTG